MSRRHFPALLVVPAIAAGCGLVSSQAEAPVECGFVDRTALIFSGRSTTQTLGVTEAPGDPMRNDPADIYITREEFEQGDLRGRLVCAVYPNTPGFVEVTVAPVGWDPPSSEESAVGPTADSSASSSQGAIPRGSPVGLSRAAAIAAAREAAPEAEEWDVASVTAGPLADVFSGRGEFDWSRDLPANRWVWIISFVEGDEGAFVVLDFADGSVYDVTRVIVN